MQKALSLRHSSQLLPLSSAIISSPLIWTIPVRAPAAREVSAGGKKADSHLSTGFSSHSLGCRAPSCVGKGLSHHFGSLYSHEVCAIGSFVSINCLLLCLPLALLLISKLIFSLLSTHIRSLLVERNCLIP